MAGSNLGAQAPETLPPSPPRHTLRLLPGTTRTRRNHGVFLLGEQLLAVYSSRRAGAAGVLLEVGGDVLIARGRMTAERARALALCLLAAADAAAAGAHHG